MPLIERASEVFSEKQNAKILKYLEMQVAKRGIK